jgi:hypothetical protein
MGARKTGNKPRPWTIETVRQRCDEVGECWIWKHSCKSGRIPQATIEGKTGQSVRPFVYDVLLGKQRPAASTVGCSCTEKLCLNPEHLVWKSRSQVVASTYRSGARSRAAMTLQRRANAIAQGIAKIDLQKATEIRARRAEKSSDLAAEYGIDTSTVRAIWRNRIWKCTTASIFTLGGMT